MSSFVLDLIKEAEFNEDEERFLYWDNVRVALWDLTIRQMNDLIRYGRFSYNDVNILPLVERDRFISLTKERKAEEDSVRDSELGALLAMFKRGVG